MHAVKANAFLIGLDSFVLTMNEVPYFYRRTFANLEWTNARSICLLGSIVMILKESISLSFYRIVSICDLYTCNFIQRIVIIYCFYIDSHIPSCLCWFTDMLPGLLQGQEKMSKSDTSSAIFMEDEEVLFDRYLSFCQSCH